MPRIATPTLALLASLLAPDLRAQAMLSGLNGAAGAQLGAAVCTAHDVDQDGVDDLLVGSPAASTTGPSAGRVQFISGATGAVLLGRDGPTPFAQFGAAVARLIDYDADGAPELLVGAPGTGGASPRGALYVLHGRTLATVLVVDGPSTASRLGRRVLLLNDLNGDGLPEFAASAPGFDNGLVFSAGAVIVYDGMSAQVLRLFPGSLAFDSFGESLSRVDDVSGDGRAELLIGAPGADPQGLSGAGLVSLIDPVTGILLRTYPGTAVGQAFGTTCAGVQDTNGDGVPEVLIGAPAASPGGVSFAGQAELLDAMSGASLRSYVGTAANQQLGATVAGLGDLDRDGRGDYAVGSPFANSSAGLAAAGRVTLFRGATQGMLWTFEGKAANGGFGAVVAAVGDLDHDGRPDFAIGSPRGDGGGTDDGRVEVRRGHVGAVSIASSGKMGTPWTLSVHAVPNVPAFALLDFAPGQVPSAYGEFCLALSPQLLIAALPAIGADGITTAGGVIPAIGIPPNTTFYFQCVVGDPVAFSGFLTSACATLTVVP